MLTVKRIRITKYFVLTNATRVSNWIGGGVTSTGIVISSRIRSFAQINVVSWKITHNIMRTIGKILRHIPRQTEAMTTTI
tara:strand:+ start:88 stop:327 length:240 start_codon:yes stop_codon:yes gene_type:complete